MMNNVKGIGLTGAVITLGLVLALTALVTSNTFAQANSDDSDSNTPATGVPTISGTAQLGETLTVDVSGIADEDGLENAIYQFTWYGGEGWILMFTAPYPADADPDTIASYFDYEVHWLAVGMEISVQVYFKDDAGNEERLTSEPTAVVPGGPMDGITLVDTSDQSDVATLTDYSGNEFTLDDPANGSYGFRVELAADAVVGSIHLELSDDFGRKNVSRTDNSAPFSLYGDDVNGLLGEGLPAGSYSYYLSATAYSESDLGGDPLQALTVSFTVTAELSVSYDRESYSVSEGSSVTVQVNLSSPADQTVTVPITFGGTAGTGNYTVSGLTNDELVFNSGDSSKSFTIDTNTDADTSNETISLGFGTITGAQEGTPSTATVTIRDTTPDPKRSTGKGGGSGGGGGGGGGANRRPNVEGPVNPSYQENGTGPVATYTANDPDDDAITWDIQIVGREDGDKFIISGDGSLSFKEPPDYENPTGFRGNTYRVRIRVTDDGSPSRTDTLRVDVQVTNLNEVGPVTGDAALSIAEDRTGVIGQYQAEDPEGDAVTWSLSGPDASGFAIDQEGNLSLPNPLSGSSAGTNVHSLTVAATDDGSPHASAQLDITVSVGGESQGLVGSGISGGDVRIAARRLADSRVEFALQQQDSTGDWGERLLPTARFLPSDAQANQWFNSSSLSPYYGETDLMVRISARRLADGRVEFALQQQADGDWGERLLPSARFLPSDAAANQWLTSTAVTLTPPSASTSTEEGG